MDERTRNSLVKLFRNLHHERFYSETGVRSDRSTIGRDSRANRVIHQILEQGYYVLISTSPAKDGFYAAIADRDKKTVILDWELGLDFSQDPELKARFFDKDSENDTE